MWWDSRFIDSMGSISCPRQGVGSRIAVSLDVAVLGLGPEPGPTLPLGRYAHLRVADDGCGIDPQAQDHIFEPFFTTKPVGHGTGLGLAVVHGIVTAHGGAITVDSVLGRGTTFDIYLPLVNASGDVPPAESQTAPAPLGGQGQHVLYVDDDEVMPLMVQETLMRLGYRVTTCSDPLMAVAAVRNQPLAFDIVVTDFNMPGMSGLELARSVMNFRPELPVVISSGVVDGGLRSEAARLGVRDVLRKEDTYDELGGLVHRVLSGE